ncbi:cytochrome P450 [Annulohypoxylon moriforme]|nr:cytochrome P450 [Annulohypoxylon moriforme]
MISIVVTLLIGAFTAYSILWALFQSTQDANEPPPVDTSIPFVSAIVHAGWHGMNHWHRHQYSQPLIRPIIGLPIYTLRVPGFRLYVVNSTALIPIIQRRVKTISFSPIMVEMAARYMAVSKEAFKVISKNPMDDHGFIAGMSKTTHVDLSHGPQLDSLNEKTIQALSASLDRIAASKGIVYMKRWVDTEIMMATTEGIYGPMNPFQDSKVVEAWTTYEAGLLPLLVNILPSITARGSIRARESLVRAYERYYIGGGHTHASAFIKHRCEFYLERGIPFADIARIEVGAAIGLISNSKPAAFWLLYHICSDPGVLNDCREELANAVRADELSNTYIIDMSYVKTSCPILLSTFKEVFRSHGTGVALRTVLEDEKLNDGQLLLKKGSLLLIPAAIQHTIPSGKRLNPVAFRGFGGGATLCPGRHFATTEILAFVSSVILRFDVRPSGGSWIRLPVKNSKPGLAVDQPDYDLQVELIPRYDRSAKWSASFPGAEILKFEVRK